MGESSRSPILNKTAQPPSSSQTPPTLPTSDSPEQDLAPRNMDFIEHLKGCSKNYKIHELTKITHHTMGYRHPILIRFFSSPTPYAPYHFYLLLSQPANTVTASKAPSRGERDGEVGLANRWHVAHAPLAGRGRHRTTTCYGGQLPPWHIAQPSPATKPPSLNQPHTLRVQEDVDLCVCWCLF